MNPTRVFGHAPGPPGATLTRAAADAGPWPVPTTTKVAARDLRELRELSLDLIGLALDLAGIVDPTPASDGASALLSLARGRWLDAAVSGLSAAVPYIGDLAKAGKLPRYFRSLGRAIELAERTGQAALLLPGIRQIERALTWFPAGANKVLDEIRYLCAAFTRRHGKRAVRVARRDVSRTFRKSFSDGSTRRIEGRLGIPSRVKRHRSQREQDLLKTEYPGDLFVLRKNPKAPTEAPNGYLGDAGHLIGNQFGGPGGWMNMVIMTRPANRKRFKRLENMWAKLLERGEGVYARVVIDTPHASNWAEYISVRWERIDVHGKVHRYPPETFRNFDRRVP